MNLIVKSPAWDDLREIGLRIAEDNQDAAERFLEGGEGIIRYSQESPKNWTPAQLLNHWSPVVGNSRFPELPDFYLPYTNLKISARLVPLALYSSSSLGPDSSLTPSDKSFLNNVYSCRKSLHFK